MSSTETQGEWQEVAKIASDAVTKIDAWEGEAIKLFKALENASLPEAEAYLRLNPPSTGAMGFLLLVARDSFKIEQAKSGGLARVAKDKRQADKMLVRSCWDIWQTNSSNYPTKAAFARDMLEKCEKLTNTKVIEDWCREWEKGRKNVAPN